MKNGLDFNQFISQIGLSSSLPINDAFPMKKLQARHDLSAVELRSLLGESTTLLDVEHQVATIQVLHHKK
jgi:hypothetical protein